jgi:predicted Rossmann fold flavoprotein
MDIEKEKHISTIVVIGAGAAGFFSAIHNKQNNPKSRVIILEKSAHVLSKVKISGGGRCNVTHACFDPKQLCNYYPRGAKALRSVFYRFQPEDTMTWFEDRGVKLKIESDNRVFPVSNNSQSIIDCLEKTAFKLEIEVYTQVKIKSIKKENKLFYIENDKKNNIQCHKLILATGSSKFGYELAKKLGHNIKGPVPSLFTFKVADSNLHKLSGLSVLNGGVTLAGQKKLSHQGPLLITHWGLSGPAIIKCSAWHAEELFDKKYQVGCSINWIPHLNNQQVLDQLHMFKTKHAKKKIGTISLLETLPTRLWGYLLAKIKVDVNRSWNCLSAKELNKIAIELQASKFNIIGKGIFKEEFVTCGGVDLDEINFKTMESKKCRGLHIVGELLDIDGITGGFNFQNAWSTGFVSGSK